MGKKSNINPLLKIINRGAVDLVIAPSMEIVGRYGRHAGSRRDTLVLQHLDGVQRVGIVPSIGSTDTHYLVAQFFPLSGELADSSRKRALRMVSALRQEHVVFDVLSDDPDKSLLSTTTYKIPLHLELHATMSSEVFQMWFLFDREIDRGRAWLTLQSLLMSLGVQQSTRILPYPHFRPQQHVLDTVWLPYYGGNPDMIHGQLLGGTPDGRSIMLDTSQNPPSDITALPLALEEIQTKEFDRLQEIAAPFISKARTCIPRPPDRPAPPSQASSTFAHGEDSDVMQPRFLLRRIRLNLVIRRQMRLRRPTILMTRASLVQTRIGLPGKLFSRRFARTSSVRGFSPQEGLWTKILMCSVRF